MSNKNANLSAVGNGEIVMKGVHININVDEVTVRGNGNINVAAREDGNRDRQDRNHDRDHRAQDRQAKQDRNAQRRDEVIMKMLQQVSDQLANIARHQNHL